MSGIDFAKLPPHLRELNPQLFDSDNLRIADKPQKGATRLVDTSPLYLPPDCVPWSYVTGSAFERLVCQKCVAPIAHAVTQVNVVRFVFDCRCEPEVRDIVLGGKCADTTNATAREE